MVLDAALCPSAGTLTGGVVSLAVGLTSVILTALLCLLRQLRRRYRTELVEILHVMEAGVIPEGAHRQDRYCRVCARTTPHWGLCTTIEDMVEDRDMRPSGSIEAWICAECRHRENVIASSEPAPTEQSRADLERWEDEGGVPGPE